MSYAGEIEYFGPEHWTGSTDPAVKAVLDVEMVEGRPAWARLLVSPALGDRDLAEFVDEAVRPRLDRLAEHGAEPDGWYVVSTGHLQLTLVARYLPDPEL